MKIVRAYKNVWSVSRNLYINLKGLSFQFSFLFVGVWIVLEIFMITVGRYLPIPASFDNPVVRYVAIPCGVAWFMDKKTFDDKRPYNFLWSVVRYLFRPKDTFLGRKVEYRDERIREIPTVVRVVAEEEKEKDFSGKQKGEEGCIE